MLYNLCLPQEKSKDKKSTQVGRKDEEKLGKKITLTESTVSVFNVCSCGCLCGPCGSSCDGWWCLSVSMGRVDLAVTDGGVCLSLWALLI